MAFLNPALLWGCLSCLVPVLIYLIFQRKIKEMDWAAMQFLLDIMEQKRKTTIEDLLLLLLRMLILLLLALAIARPFLNLGAVTDLIGSDADVVIVLDNSYSMGATTGAQSRWDKAKSFATHIVDKQSGGNRYCILLASELPDPIMADYASDSSLIMETTRGLKLSALHSDWSRSLAALNNLLKKSKRSLKKVYIISDFQQSDWQEQDQTVHKAILNLQKDTQLTLVNVGDKTQDNLSALRLRLSAGAMRVGTKAVFAADIQNNNTETAEDVPVDFLIDDAVVESSTISIPAQQSATIRFKYEATQDGAHAASVRIRSDILESDNKVYLPFKVVESIPALAISEGENSFGFRPTQFIELALNPFNDGSNSDQALYHFNNINIADLTGEDLAQYNFICISGVSALSSVEASMLEEYVQNGGGLLFFLSENTDIPTFNNNLYKDGAGLVSWPLMTEKIAKKNDKDPMQLQAVNLSHPLWHGLLSAQNDYLKHVNVYSAFAFDKGSEERATPLANIISDSSAAAAGSTGGDAGVATEKTKPVIVDFKKGRGHCIVIGTSSDLSMNDLITHPVFVGLINQATKYAQSFRSGDTVITAGGTAIRYVGLASSQANFVCSSPSDEQSILPVTGSANEFKVELTELREAGIYHLVNQNDSSDASLIAVNVSPGEGDITSMESPAIAALFPDIELKVIDAATSSEIEEAATDGGGIELASFLLTLLLLCWIGENFLAHRISKR